LCLVLAGLAAAQVVTISFQNGVNGYNGTVDRQIGERDVDQKDGITVANYFLDGYKPDKSSPDAQGLVRFDGVFGADPNQIPAGATILSAELVVTTSQVGNAQTGGPYGVAGLLQAFDSQTSYFVSFATVTTDMGSRGAWWQDGSATRPVGGYGAQAQGAASSANVASVVQAWADGAPAHGFVIQAGTSDSSKTQANTVDGWSICTTGSLLTNERPLLKVSYTTAPVVRNTFQNGLKGYEGTTMALVRSGANALIADTTAPTNPERTEDGLTLNQTYLDGVQFSDAAGNTSSPDDLALLKFANVFSAEPNHAPPGVPVAKAWLVMTTGESNANAHTVGPYAAFPLLRPWDLTSLHSSFGAVNGLQVDDGDIGPALASLVGFIRGSEVWFDVTAYLEAVRTGTPDYGLAVQANGTADGWMIHTTGSTTIDARPRLVVYSGDLATK
jgi:phage gp46-like protein